MHLRSTYPMSRYFAAFDLAVSAAGYNAYHELIRFGVPALYVPMPRQTDDQAARARYAEQAGIGLAADGPDSDRIEALLDELLDPERRAAMRRAPRRAAPRGRRRRGRPLARASWRGPSAGRPGVGWGGGGAGFAGRCARRAGPPRSSPACRFTPRPSSGRRSCAGRRARWCWRSAWPQGALERELEDALARTPDPPGRVLVVTDSLDFGPLLRAGVGFEHVPGPGEAQAQLAGGDYHAFLRRRLALILAERPRPRRALTIGETGKGLLTEIA